MDTYLGIDFGGTKLLIGELDANGHVLRSKRYQTGLTKQSEAVRAIIDSIDDYIKTVGFEGTPCAVGAGIVGTVDNARGEWISIDHLIHGPAVPLAAMLQEKLGIPCGIDNDVRSAATAELILGIGQKSDNFIYINVGTGLAAGFITGGQIIRGGSSNSGEIGHMVVDMQSDAACVCGRSGCAEDAVSGIGFTRQLEKRGRKDLLTQAGGRADVPRMFEMADDGDADCIAITSYAAKTLANVIMNLVRVCDPEAIVLGGGIISDGWLLKKVLPLLEPNTMRDVRYGITLSSFAPRHAGLIGAASLAIALKRRESKHE